MIKYFMVFYNKHFVSNLAFCINYLELELVLHAVMQYPEVIGKKFKMGYHQT